MNTKLIALAVSLVAMLSLCSLAVDSSDADSEDSYQISSYVGEYWEPTYTELDPTTYKTNYVNGYKFYANLTTSADGQGYVLTIGGDNYNVNESGKVSDDSVSFNITNATYTSSTGTISFPITEVSTGRMDVSIGGTSTFCYREGDISVSGLDFKPCTLFDAVTLYHNKTDDPNKIGTTSASIQMGGQTITLPAGIYELGFNSLMYIKSMANTTGSMTIEAADGADVTVNFTKTELQSNETEGTTSLTFRNINFVAEEACRLILNNIDSISLDGCSFNKIMLSSFGNDSVSLTDNEFSGNGNTIEKNTFALYVSESRTIDISNNIIHDYLCGINIANDGANALPIDANIDSNSIYDLNSSNGDGVGIQISGKLQSASFDLRSNIITGASPAVKIHDGMTGYDNSKIESENNTFIGCNGQIQYAANDKGEIAPIPVTSIRDSAYNMDGTPTDVIISSESGIVPSVAIVSDPLTEEYEPLPPWGWDDDDDYVPPIVPAQPSDSGDDNTVTVVACAAAAVVAALMAAFLILDRKR